MGSGTANARLCFLCFPIATRRVGRRCPGDGTALRDGRRGVGGGRVRWAGSARWRWANLLRLEAVWPTYGSRQGRHGPERSATEGGLGAGRGDARPPAGGDHRSAWSSSNRLLDLAGVFCAYLGLCLHTAHVGAFLGQKGPKTGEYPQILKHCSLKGCNESFLAIRQSRAISFNEQISPKPMQSICGRYTISLL